MSNFSFSHCVFKRRVQQTRKKQGLFGKGLKTKIVILVKFNFSSAGVFNLFKPKNIAFSASSLFQIEYKLPLETLRLKILQVTIWDHDVLKENDLLGAVYIKLVDLSPTNSISKWYKLEKIQVTDFNNI